MAFRLLLAAAVSLLVSSCIAQNVLYTDEILNDGASLYEGNFRLEMQLDCNLVLYENDLAIWATGTYGRSYNCHLKMQSNGDLVVYDGDGNIVWRSNTDRGTANYLLILQEDRNLVVYGPAIWHTNTYRTLGVVVAGQKNGTSSDQEEAIEAAAGIVVNRKIATVPAN